MSLRKVTSHVEEPGPPEIPNETEEDWDAEPTVPTYNPNIHCENKPIIRSLQGAPPAARSAFREKERKPIMDIK
ncbi:GM16783 [Drosophila sechellia]|uniref:GM16783 n=1 Tax=Drosophila sechellia TaxID=7238 RepID=B4ID39_DROSE|nr:GM16783 [Drosophila sechellia]